MVRSKKSNLMTAGVFFLFGLLIVLQFRVNRDMVEKNATAEASRREALQAVLTEEKERHLRLTHDVEDLQKKLKAAQDAGGGRQIPGSLSSELDALQLDLGLTPVKGKGVRILLQTADDSYQLTAKNLLDLVNLLRYGGAEAIAINGQRIIYCSTISEAGPNMLINKMMISRKGKYAYEVLATGSPEKLAGVLDGSDSVISELEDFGVTIEYEQADNLKLPAYLGEIKFSFAVPASEPGLAAGQQAEKRKLKE